jgi:hypothetical protein
MGTDDRIAVYLMSDQVRHYEIAFGGSGLARLYVEIFRDSRGAEQSTARLHVEGDLAEDVLAAVLEAIRRDVLAKLPRGILVVYAGHILRTIDYLGAAQGG